MGETAIGDVEAFNALEGNRCRWWVGECTFFDAETGAPSFGIYFLVGLAINAVIAYFIWRVAFPKASINPLRHRGDHVPLGPCAPPEPWDKTGFWDSSDRDIRDHPAPKID